MSSEFNYLNTNVIGMQIISFGQGPQVIAIRHQNEVPNKNYVFSKWVAQVGFMTLGLLTYNKGIMMLRAKK